MKLLVDFFPLILFFVAFKLKGIFVATAVAIAATVLQLLYVWRKHGKVEPMHWASLIIIVVFGGATLWSEDPILIKWKPTVLYWLMAVALVVGHLVFKRNGIRVLLGAQIHVPDRIWNQLLWAWALFLSVLGVINLWLAYTLGNSEEGMNTWVYFKVFGGLGLMLVFVVLQTLYMSRHMMEPPASTDPDPRP